MKRVKTAELTGAALETAEAAVETIDAERLKLLLEG